MAASAPAADGQPFSMRGSAKDGFSTESLEFGMSGLSLTSAALSKGQGRKSSGSTVSSSSDHGEETRLSSNHLQPVQADAYIESNDGKESVPHSPGSGPQHDTSWKGQSKFAGYVAMVPSPIAKPGHSKNSSATSPLRTLTPSSSLDGNAEWNSLGRQTSPFAPMDGPSMPYLSADHGQRTVVEDGSSNLGSFDLGDNDNDGLLGLQALRDRAQSSPGPQRASSSPTMPARGHFPAHLATQEVPRERRDRPPLSQAHDGFTMLQGGERGLPGLILPVSKNVGRTDISGFGLDSIDSGFGAIGRTEARPSNSGYDSSHRRGNSGSDSFANSYMLQQSSGFSDHVANKFGNLTSLSSHIHQNRGESLSDVPKPRHLRSMSQPVTAPSNIGGNVSSHYGNSFDNRFYQQNAGGFLGESIYRAEQHNRSYAGSHPTHSNYDSDHFSREGGSVSSLSGRSYTHHSHSSLQRRDGFEYSNAVNAGHLSGMMVAPEDYRSYGPPSMISPGQSPLQVHYPAGGGGHSRQTSEGTSVMLSSSPISLSSGIIRSQSTSVVQGGGDDDLTHPLVGEHIEVPADHDHPLHGAYVLNHSGSHALLRNHGSGHSISLDHFPPQIIEATHHLPTAGAALPLPKVVYSVKFKRTQRNFVLGPRINRDLKIGTYVKVEADRGEDLGIVVGKIQAEKFSFSGRGPFSAGMGPSSGASDLKRIIRLATHDEVSLLGVKRDEEDELLKICRGKVRQRGLPMNVVDAEYQFDRHKLTFFFEAEGRVDFRELVRDLFSMYKTRIWMQQIDKNTSTSSPAIVAPQTNLQMDFGTPIIAPASEFADSVVLNGLSSDARTH